VLRGPDDGLLELGVVTARNPGERAVAGGRPAPRTAVTRGSVAPLAAVTAAALVFTVLLILVRLRWPPLESVDHSAAARLNRLVAGDAPGLTR
jgi:hypothetical protein